MSSLFRPEVTRYAERQRFGRIVLIRPLSFAYLTAAATGLVAIGLAYLAIGEYAKKAPVSGVLVPAAGAIRVAAPQSGTLLDRAAEGHHVEAGEEIARVGDSRRTGDGEPFAQQLDSLSDRRRQELVRQREALVAGAAREAQGLARRLAMLEAEREEALREGLRLEERRAFVDRRVERAASLAAKGFVSPAQAQAAEEERLEHRSREGAARRGLLVLEREVDGLRAALDEAAQRHRAQLAALDAQRAALDQERLERALAADATVVAPAAGHVAATLAEPGQPVAAGATILTLLPADSPLEAHLHAPSRAIGFVRAGQEVRLRFPAFPYQKFGSHRGRVTAVSRTALSPAELGYGPADGPREPLYRIRVALDGQSVRAYGRPEPLQAGMRVEADVLLDRRRLIEWVFEPLASLAGRA